MPITVELLYFEGCPSYVAFLPRLRALLAEGGVDAPVLRRRGESDQAARRERFLGRRRCASTASTSSRAQRSDYALKCRHYASPDRLRGVPPDEWLLDAPARADDRG